MGLKNCGISTFTTPTMVRRIVAMHVDYKWSPGKIARQIDRSPDNVRKILRDEGVYRPGKGNDGNPPGVDGNWKGELASMGTLMPSEQVVHDYLKSAGCEVYRHGWPDFLVVRDGKVVVVEVKTKKMSHLSSRQKKVKEILEGCGIRYLVVVADEGTQEQTRRVIEEALGR